MNNNTLIKDLTVGEFLKLISSVPKKEEQKKVKQYEYGLKGLARILGCSRSTASKIKKSGILDDAISQNGNIIVIDIQKALELFKQNSK